MDYLNFDELMKMLSVSHHMMNEAMKDNMFTKF
jgi:hypothetical protein